MQVPELIRMAADPRPPLCRGEESRRVPSGPSAPVADGPAQGTGRYVRPAALWAESAQRRVTCTSRGQGRMPGPPRHGHEGGAAMGAKPYYEIIRDTLLRNIEEGRLPAGTRLQSAALAERLSVS